MDSKTAAEHEMLNSPKAELKHGEPSMKPSSTAPTRSKTTTPGIGGPALLQGSGDLVGRVISKVAVVKPTVDPIRGI